jgi:hypothetical protein
VDEISASTVVGCSLALLLTITSGSSHLLCTELSETEHRNNNGTARCIGISKKKMLLFFVRKTSCRSRRQKIDRTLLFEDWKLMVNVLFRIDCSFLIPSEAC